MNGSFIAVVADGAGSALFGGEGASLVARTILRHAEGYFSTTVELPEDEVLWTWLDDARDRLQTAADRRGAVSRDFASTLVCAILTPTKSLLLQIGDGAMALRLGEAQEWAVPLWPAHGEYASTTYFVTEDPVPQLRIERVDEPAAAIFLMTDGLERLALSFSDHKAHGPFYDNLIKPVAAVEASGRNLPLSRQLGCYLNSEAVNSRTDDDKTLVIAVRR